MRPDQTYDMSDPVVDAAAGVKQCAGCTSGHRSFHAYSPCMHHVLAFGAELVALIQCRRRVHLHLQQMMLHSAHITVMEASGVADGSH